MRDIGIFGGSFDPPHVGHPICLLSVLMKTDLDSIRVLPTPDHAIKDHHASFQDRMAMAERTFGHLLPEVVVDDFETSLSPPHYTTDTLRALNDRYEANYYFIIGGDLVEEIPRWEKADRLTDLATIIVIPRHGYPIVDPPEEIGDFIEVDIGVDLPEVSSTKVRDLLDRGASVDQFLPNSVVDYIEQNGLYG